MSRATIAALSLLLAAGSPACALVDADQSAPAGCLTYEMATEAATRALENDPDGRLMLFAGLDAAALLKAINDPPPQTDFRADHILVVQRAAKDNVRIGLTVDGCFRGPFAMKEADWEKLKAAVAEQFSSQLGDGVEISQMRRGPSPLVGPCRGTHPCEGLTDEGDRAERDGSVQLR